MAERCNKTHCLKKVPKIRKVNTIAIVLVKVDTFLFRLCGELCECKCFIVILWEITSFGNAYDSGRCDIKQTEQQKFTGDIMIT